MFPSGHGLRVFRCQQSAPPDRSQQSPAHGGLDLSDCRCIQSAGWVKGYASLRIGVKHTIDDDAVLVEMGVELLDPVASWGMNSLYSACKRIFY